MGSGFSYCIKWNVDVTTLPDAEHHALVKLKWLFPDFTPEMRYRDGLTYNVFQDDRQVAIVEIALGVCHVRS